MHRNRPDLAAAPAAHGRWKRLAALSVAALLLHAGALSGLEWAWPANEPPPVPSAAARLPVVDLPPWVPAALTPVTERPAERAVPAVRPPAKPSLALAKPALARTALAAAPAAVPQAVELPIPAAPASTVPNADEETIPRYRTLIPPAATLRYELRRGSLAGTAELSWRPQGDRYELRLEARASGLPVLMQVSSGSFDAAGLAPDRFTDQRLRKAATAANFQRAAGKITFSGPSTEFALRDGAQDRLSWMIQLAAIVAAEPQRALAGAKVVVYVVGSHGDAGVWVFRCLGPETLASRAGEIDAIKFVREPREAYDTLVQVWLDPLRHGLPVRATQKSGPGDEGFELSLRELVLSN